MPSKPKGKQVVRSEKPNLTQIGLIELGQMIKYKRTANHLKVKDAADLLGISVTTLIKIEKGEPTVSSGNFFKAIAGFGIELTIDDHIE